MAAPDNSSTQSETDDSQPLSQQSDSQVFDESIDHTDEDDNAEEEVEQDDEQFALLEFGDNPILYDGWNREAQRWDFWVAPNNSKLERWVNKIHLPEELLRAWTNKNPVLVAEDSEDEDSEIGAAMEEDDEQETQPDSGPSRAITDDDHAKSMNPFYPYLRSGYWAIACATFDEAKADKVTKNLPSVAQWEDICREIMAGTPSSILLAVLGAGLTRMRIADSETADALSELRSHAHDRPCIYLLELVNDEGFGPTMAEMRKVIDAARSYMDLELEDDNAEELVIKIDSVKETLSPHEEQARSESGFRRYLTKDSQRDTLKAFLNSLESELDQIGIGNDDRIPFLLKHVGYTKNGTRRIEREHLQHVDGSNRLMNLIEAICIVLFNGRYRIHGDVIFLCYQKHHAKHGEVFWTILSRSYVQTGRGFNGHSAGLSLGPIEKYDGRWNEFAVQTAKEGPFYENCIREADSVYQANRALDELDLQIQIEKALILDTGIGVEKAYKRAAEEYSALEAELFSS